MFLRNLLEISRIFQLYNSDIFFPHIDLQHHESATLCSPVASHDPSIANFPWYTFTWLYIPCLPAGCTCIPSRDPSLAASSVCVCFLLFSLYLLLGEFSRLQYSSHFSRFYHTHQLYTRSWILAKESVYTF